MQVTAAVVIAVMGTGLGLLAGVQPGGSAPTTPATPTTPSMEPERTMTTTKGEAPDGTMLDVVKTSSLCLLIEDLKIGEGAEATGASTITIHYHGTLKDGKVFDSTRGKEPITFPLQRLIQGWQLGIPGMKVGGVRRLTIPWQLAYGEREIPDQGGGVLIPAKSDLVFSIELKGVK